MRLRFAVAVAVLVLIVGGAISPAFANHGKRCTIAVHQGPVKVFADCHQHDNP